MSTDASTLHTTRFGDNRWPLGGPAYAALLVIGAVAFPMPPGGDVTGAAHPSWLATHTGAAITQGLIRSLAALAFVVLAVGAAQACARTLPRTSSLPAATLTGGVLSGGLMLAAQTTALASALFVRAGGQADATRALGSLQAAFLDISSLPATLLFLGVGLTSLRTGLLPRWLGLLTLLGVPLALIDAGSYPGGPFAPVAFLGLVYFLAWSLIAGSWLVRPDSTPQPHPHQA